MKSRVPEDRDGARTRLERLFFAAAERTPETQAAFLERECGADAELAASVRALLETERKQQHDSQWERSAWDASILRFGRYRVTNRIGIGGMGVVYAAVRDDSEFEKRVAIKAILPGLVTKAGAASLRRERQILAQLEHPYIARLLDGGTTPDGIPFLAMEYVEGRPLLEYADTNSLRTADRLDLFHLICEGVAYAHQRLVTHRDIKPSNILVTADGTPKLLDFGLARLLDPDADVTVPEARAMTPGYASPEQLQGRRITTASYIYSLGMILFVLLTGRHPFPSASPAKGSSGKQPDREMEQLARATLKGDLFNIVCKALRQDPAERYSSVEQFAADIRRFRRDRPIYARPRTIAYRLRKYCARNRVALIAAALGMVACAFGASFKAAEMRSTERRFHDVQNLAASFVFEIPDTIENVPGTLAVRQLMVTRATAYLDSLAEDSGRDTGLQHQLAAAYDRIGSLTFNTTKSLDLHRKALTISRSLVAAQPGNEKYREQLYQSYSLVGDLLREQGNTAGAIENYRQAMAAMESLGRNAPNVPQYALDLADAYGQMGMMLSHAGRNDDALGYYNKGMALLRALADAAPGNLAYRHALRTSYASHGRVEADKGELARSLASGGEALALAQSLVEAEPSNAMYRRDLWVSQMGVARSLALAGETRRAVQEYRGSLALIEELSTADPGDRGHRRGVAVNCLYLADALASLHWKREALASYAKAISISGNLLLADPNKLETTGDLARMHAGVGSLYLREGSLTKAHLELGKAADLFRGAFERDPTDAALRHDRAECEMKLNEPAMQHIPGTS
jgi:tetratricopeptide (TPR) repeat protein